MQRTALFVLSTLATLLVLEIFLQAGHFVAVASHTRKVEARSETTRKILCVGDSFTFGIGAASQETSYPGSLERLLGDRPGPEIEVVNAGWPGQNSFDIGEKLPSQLEDLSPSIVLILAGTNDRWSRPDPLFEAPSIEVETSPEYRLEWRTLRLIKLLGHAWSNSSRGDTVIDAEEDLPPALPGPTLVEVPDDNYIAAAWKLTHEERFADVVLVAERGLEENRHPNRSHTLMRLQARALSRLGRQDEALEISAELERMYDDQPEISRAEAVVDVLTSIGKKAEAVERSREATRIYPHLALAWQVLGWNGIETGDHDAAIEAFGKVIEQDIGDNWRANALRYLAKARILGEREPEATVHLLLESVILDQNVDAAVLALRHSQELNDGEAIRRYAESFEMNDDDQEILGRLIRAVEEYDFQSILKQNLEKIVAYTRAAGAIPVLLSYPRCVEEVTEVQAEVARSQGVQWIDVCEEFERELQSRALEELFIADGHCNDAGYAMMADIVADALELPDG